MTKKMIGQAVPKEEYFVYGSMMIHQAKAPNKKPDVNVRNKYARLVINCRQEDMSVSMDL